MSLWGEYKAGLLDESQYVRACNEEEARYRWELEHGYFDEDDEEDKDDVQSDV